MLVVQFVATSAGGEKGIVLHDDRHANGGHFAYADGHVELVAETQVNDWVNEGFEFAKPNR